MKGGRSVIKAGEVIQRQQVFLFWSERAG